MFAWVKWLSNICLLFSELSNHCAGFWLWNLKHLINSWFLPAKEQKVDELRLWGVVVGNGRDQNIPWEVKWVWSHVLPCLCRCSECSQSTGRTPTPLKISYCCAVPHMLGGGWLQPGTQTRNRSLRENMAQENLRSFSLFRSTFSNLISSLQCGPLTCKTPGTAHNSLHEVTFSAFVRHIVNLPAADPQTGSETPWGQEGDRVSFPGKGYHTAAKRREQKVDRLFAAKASLLSCCIVYVPIIVCPACLPARPPVHFTFSMNWSSGNSVLMSSL